MGTPERQRFVSEQEFLEKERDSEFRHEYVDGVLFSMVGASREHGLIASNLVAAIRPHLRGSKCRVTASDMKVALFSANSNTTLGRGSAMTDRYKWSACSG